MVAINTVNTATVVNESVSGQDLATVRMSNDILTKGTAGQTFSQQYLDTKNTEREI